MFAVTSYVSSGSLLWQVQFFLKSSVGAAASEPETLRNNKMMKAGSVLGTALEPLELVVERRMLCKLLNIMGNTTYPLNNNNLYIYCNSLFSLFTYFIVCVFASYLCFCHLCELLRKQH